MIVVKVELHSAVTGKTTLLGQAIISNDGTAIEPRYGNYNVAVGRKNQTELRDIFTKPVRRASVLGYPRLKLPIWSLVKRSLEAAGYK